jgi:DNA-binding NarL/FixJ family response regulator
MAEQIKILVVDDHTLFRRGVMELLSQEPDFALVGEAHSGLTALRLSQQLEPDVVLMDVRMPEGSGVDAVRTMKQGLEVRILMLTVSAKDQDLMDAIQAGADGYLLKSAEPEELCQAIRQVASGQAVLSPEVTATVMQAAARSRSHESQVSLSPREREVLAKLAQGATTAEVAAALVISSSTVKTHIHHILEKLGAANRAEAVGRAIAMGFLDDDPLNRKGKPTDPKG